MNNRFLTDPVRVIVRGDTGDTGYVFLGDAPAGILNSAAKYRNKLLAKTVLPSGRHLPNGRPNKANTTSQKTGNDIVSAKKILLNYYGSEFAAKLMLDGPGQYTGSYERSAANGRVSRPMLRSAIGSAEGHGGDIADDIEQLLADPSNAFKTHMAKARRHSHPGGHTTTHHPPAINMPAEQVTSIHIFPEDNFADLKEKIYLATGIPAYRQHLAYNHNGVMTSPYRLYAEGLYDTDIRKANSRTRAIGLPVDRELYEMRDSVRVEAADTFSILDSSLDDNTVYVTDLDSYTRAARTQLVAACGDVYQFELVYYGFIILYWPQLTQECFRDYIIDEPGLVDKYPDLARDPATIATVRRAERDLIVETYRVAVKAATRELPMAIHRAVAMVIARGVAINIRNLFDEIRATRNIPEIHAYVEHGGKKYLLRKRHAMSAEIPFPSGPLMKVGLTMAISMYKEDCDNLHANALSGSYNRYLFLNIWPMGKYYVRSSWVEEEGMDFAKLAGLLKKFINPIITNINACRAFSAGRALPSIKKSNLTYVSLTACLYWRKMLSDATFKSVRELWSVYARAGVVSARPGNQELLFRKGIHEFDSKTVDRIISASNNIILSNTYAYLSNNTVKQKWDQNYSGCVVRMLHRTTDVKIEVADIRAGEFALFKHYIAAFIHRADSLNIPAVTLGKSTRRLRRLREIDPALYNLKKYGSERLYSIICQNPRQPIIYTDEDLKGLSNADLNNLSKYWNFTLNKPVYYGCPDKKYPQLNFIAGIHPKGWCLPCCNMIIAKDNHKQGQINAACLRDHKYILTAGQTGDAGPSKHVIQYGKELDQGRLSKIPFVLRRLLANKPANGKQVVDPANLGCAPCNGTQGQNTSEHRTAIGYYVYGVAQNFPNTNKVGVAYSLAAALGLSINELAAEIGRRIKLAPRCLDAMPSAISFYDGAAGYTGGSHGVHNHADNQEGSARIDTILRSGSALITALHDAISDSNYREIRPFDKWNELFCEIADVLFDKHVVMFIDTEAGLKLKARNIHHRGYVVMINRQGYYFPIFLTDAAAFFKDGSVVNRIHEHGSQMAALIDSMIASATPSGVMGLPGGQAAAYARISVDLLSSLPGYVVKLLYAGRVGTLYAALVEGPTGIVYCPLDGEPIPRDGLIGKLPPQGTANSPGRSAINAKNVISYDPFVRRVHALPATAVIHFIDSLRTHSKLVIDLTEYVKCGTEIIGLSTSIGIFYLAGDKPALGHDIDLPTRSMAYDSSEVNAAIVSAESSHVDARLARKYSAAMYENNLYYLFLLEFVAFLGAERNTVMRRMLADLIKATNFKKSAEAFRKELATLMERYPNDLRVIHGQLAGFYDDYNKNELLSNIDQCDYDFDRKTALQLAVLPPAELIVRLKKIAAAITVRKDFDPTNAGFPNLFTPCAEGSRAGRIAPYCATRKLIVNQDIEPLVELLAADLANPLKAPYIMNSLWLDTIVDWFHFEMMPTETLSIYYIAGHRAWRHA